MSMKSIYSMLLVLGLPLLFVSACSKQPPAPPAAAEIALGSKLPKTRFIQENGQILDIKNLEEKKNILLVVMRGFDGIVCPYCTQQASELIQNIETIKSHDTELLLVYPGPEARIADFVKAVNVKLKPKGLDMKVPLLMDVNLEAVKAMGIQGKLAKPSTLILNRKGEVVYKFIGKDFKDRPETTAVLDELKKLSP